MAADATFDHGRDERRSGMADEILTAEQRHQWKEDGTDVDAADSGNFTVIPGSHRRAFPSGGGEGGPYNPEAIQL